MKKSVILLLIFTVSIFLSGCSTALYIGAQCRGNDKDIYESSEYPVGNTLNTAFMLYHEMWYPPDDYVLPPALNRCLNRSALIVGVSD